MQDRYYSLRNTALDSLDVVDQDHQESTRILGEAINPSREGQLALQGAPSHTPLMSEAEPPKVGAGGTK
jgi:hypothetical protein